MLTIASDEQSSIDSRRGNPVGQRLSQRDKPSGFASEFYRNERRNGPAGSFVKREKRKKNCSFAADFRPPDPDENLISIEGEQIFDESRSMTIAYSLKRGRNHRRFPKHGGTEREVEKSGSAQSTHRTSRAGGRPLPPIPSISTAE